MILDGIEHVHESMYKLYEDMEEENNMIFDGKRVERRLMDIEENEGENERFDYGDLIYSEEEREDLYNRSFKRRKTEYMEVKNGLEEIKNL